MTCPYCCPSAGSRDILAHSAQRHIARGYAATAGRAGRGRRRAGRTGPGDYADPVAATRLLVLGVVRGYGRAHGYLVGTDLLGWEADRWANVK